MKRRRERPRYASEAELCSTLAAAARRWGFAVHAETSGWDLLLVARDGLQVGVQAKLRASVDVLAQAMTSRWQKGPDVHAVLVPEASRAFRQVAGAVQVAVIDGPISDPVLASAYLGALDKAPRWKHRGGRCWVPDVEVETPAGVPAPRSTTPWKLAAVRLSLLLRDRGYLTSRDFAAAKVSIRWWTEPRHVAASGKTSLLVGVRMEGEKLLRYYPSSSAAAGAAKLPDELYPEITAAVQAQPAG